MRIKIHDNAANNYMARCYRHARPSAYGLHRPEWYKVLEMVQGKWLDVDTEHLFADQFNTTAIEGVSEQGLRVMQEDVVDIEDDVREGVFKCQWCYGYDRDHDGAFDKCGKTDHLRPLVPVKLASV